MPGVSFCDAVLLNILVRSQPAVHNAVSRLSHLVSAPRLEAAATPGYLDTYQGALDDIVSAVLSVESLSDLLHLQQLDSYSENDIDGFSDGASNSDIDGVFDSAIPRGLTERSPESSAVTVTFPADPLSKDDVITCAFPALELALTTRSLDELSRLVVVDTGCSRHMTHNAALLKDLLYFDAHCLSIPRVQMGSGPSIAAAGMGTLQVLTQGWRPSNPKVPVPVTLAFPNTLLIPQLQLTLLSGGGLLYDASTPRAPTGHFLHFGGPSSYLELNNGVCVSLEHNVFNLFALPITATSAPPVALAAISASVSVWRAHAALGHANLQSVCELLDVPVPVSTSCTICMLAKQKRSILTLPVLGQTATRPGELLYIDVTGPLPEPTLGGARYLLGVIDAHTGVIVVQLLKSRARLDTVMDRIETDLLALNIVIKDKATQLFSDQEFLTTGMTVWCTARGIRQLLSPSGEPRRNLMERAWLSIFDRIRVMLFVSRLPLSYWGLAALHAVYLLNRTPTRRPGHAVPLVLARGSPFTSGDITFLVTLPDFGSRAAIFDPTAHRTAPSAIEGIFVGVQAASQAYRLLVNNVERVSVHVKWLPSPPAPTTPPSAALLQFEYQPASVPVASTGPVGATPAGPTGPVGSTAPLVSVVEPSSSITSASRPTTPVPPATPVSPVAVPTTSADADGDDPLLMNFALAAFAEHSPCTSGFPYMCSAAVSGFADVISGDTADPKSYRQAMASAAAPQWEQAIAKHMATALQFDTYDLVPRSAVPSTAHIARSHFIFKCKYDAVTGAVVEHKARWVVDGNLIPVDETDPFASSLFSPVVGITSGRALLAVAALRDLRLMIVDVSSAFLQADYLTEPVYVYMPRGYPCEDDQGRQLIVVLKKPLFGLPQAPRLWFNTLNRVLVTELHLVQCPRDPCLYVARVDTPEMLLACVTVDDCLIASKHQATLDAFVAALGARFELSKSGPTKAWVGMAVEHDLSAGTLSLSLGAYLRRAFGAYDLLSLPPSTTPMSSTTDLCHELSRRPVLCARDHKLFQQLLGICVYATTVVRFDALLATHKLASHMAAPNDLHMSALRHLIGYLVSTSDLPLTYCRAGNAQLVTYVDAGYPGDRDNRSSLSGATLQFAGAALAALCKRQKVVVLSSTEAEYMALAMAIRRLLVLLAILAFLGEPQAEPVRVLEDNQPAIRVANNPLALRLSQHIDVRAHFIRQLIVDGRVVLEYCPSADNVADMLTKPLARVLFRKFRALLMGCDIKPLRVVPSGCKPPLAAIAPPVSSEPSRVARPVVPLSVPAAVDDLVKPLKSRVPRVRFADAHPS